MLLALLLAAPWPTLVTLPPGSAAPTPSCHNPATRFVNDHEAPVVRPLADEPPARQILGVLNTTPDGCVTPIVVRAEVGHHNR